jgi:FMN phosphatase YigB (HAD superfamily)
MKSTIFLDLDGVMATTSEYYQSVKNFWEKYDFARDIGMQYRFNPGCVKVLNKILEITDADIVLTSDWREDYNLQTLDNIFKFNKVIKSPIDVTDVYSKTMQELEKFRASEINDYIYKKNITNYVIIDDLDLSPFVSQDKFIRTINREGIKQSNIKEKILKILQYE